MEFIIIKSRATVLSRSQQSCDGGKVIVPTSPCKWAGGQWLQMTGALLLSNVTVQCTDVEVNAGHFGLRR